MLYEIEEYMASNGKSPYAVWFGDLRDGIARVRIAARIERAKQGNFGDWKSLVGAKGIFEMREHYGSGYRIFFSIIGQKVVLLLAGSSKKDQARTIAKAKQYMADYEKRSKR